MQLEGIQTFRSHKYNTSVKDMQDQMMQNFAVQHGSSGSRILYLVITWKAIR
jgi:hypothetical protein